MNMQTVEKTPAATRAQSSHLRAEIFCGGTIPGRNGDASQSVGDNAWQDFLRQHCRFPGFTVLEGAGFWNDPDPAKWSGREHTRVVSVYGPNTVTFVAEVRKFAAAYTREFAQDCTAFAFSPAGFGFAYQSEELGPVTTH